MKKRLAEYRDFFREFRRQFQTTGAILPSSRFLAAALSRHVADSDAPRRILEVGPGTGAVTKQIVKRMSSDDHFDLVELNESFVQVLEQRFASEADFQRVADRSRVLHQSIEELDEAEAYDVIISGLPLNNFSAELVESILEVLTRLLKPGGTLSFFAYIAIRSARSGMARGEERERLRGIHVAIKRLLDSHGLGREWIWVNVPPAWVHHVRKA